MHYNYAKQMNKHGYFVCIGNEINGSLDKPR